MARGSDTKKKLMDAVLELIWQGSYGRTTVDQICEKAEVNKGSFYHFFESKSLLAAAALEESWQGHKTELDAIFSPIVPPLDRLRALCEQGYEEQAELKKKYGCVLGCPLYTLGAEICNQEESLRTKIREILNHYHKYLETAIRDAQAEGLIDAPDANLKARMLFAYSQGLLTQARILNEVEILREMYAGILIILGTPVTLPTAPVAA